MAGRPSQSDNDQYNRIFIIGISDCIAEDIREAFDKFGEVTDVYIPRGKLSRENKSIAYVTFSKASEAALAIEQMNGKSVTEKGRPVKVVLANSKRQGNVRDQHEDEKMMRLFIMVPTSFTQKDIEDEFSKFGHVESVHIVKDRQTGHSRGLAYVRFTRAYNAAIALENCDPKFKPVFADSPRPRVGSDSHSSSAPGASSHGFSQRSSADYERTRLLEPPLPRQRPPLPAYSLNPGVLESLGGYSQQTETVLEAYLCPDLNYEQVSALFDIVPGLDTCHYDHTTGKAYVKYLTPQAAAYARDKISNFQYPPGYRIVIHFLARSSSGRDMASSAALPAAVDSLAGVQTLVSSIQQAMSVLQQNAMPGGASSSYPRTNTRSPSGSYSHSGKRSYGNDDDYRPTSSRKSSRFS